MSAKMLYTQLLRTSATVVCGGFITLALPTTIGLELGGGMLFVWFAGEILF